MQNVSDAYKQSMKSPLRERAFIKLSFGLTSIESQSKAMIVDKGEFAYYSNKNIFKKQADGIEYAAFEEFFTKTDGSMFFPPRQQSGNFYNTSLVSKDILTNKPFEVFIQFNSTKKINLQGLILTFAENFPVKFEIKVNNVLFESVMNNRNSVWSTKRILTNVSSITLVFYRLQTRRCRLRIRSIEFGYTLIYDNDSILSSSLDSYVSPISENIPQIDFSIQIDNHDSHFNMDNPDSIVHFFESGQKMDIEYGYQLPNSNTIEWIPGNHLVCSSWDSDNTSVTIRGQDIFRNMTSEYLKGRVLLNTEPGKSYYAIAQDIFNDVGITKYYIDPSLNNLYTRNAIPKVKHKEALQIIANASGCTLLQSRTGEIRIERLKAPRANEIQFTMEKSNMTSSPKVTKLETVKDIVVPYYLYDKGTSNEETVVEKQVQVTAGQIDTFYFDKPAHSHICYLNGNATGHVVIKEAGSYSMTVQYLVTGSYRLSVRCRYFNLVVKHVTKTIDSRGKTIKWNNPLIDSEDTANRLANQLVEYYKMSTEYEYDTRGNPELDVTDYIYQENDFQSNMVVNICRHSINFNQVFSGKITTRKVGE